MRLSFLPTKDLAYVTAEVQNSGQSPAINVRWKVALNVGFIVVMPDKTACVLERTSDRLWPGPFDIGDDIAAGTTITPHPRASGLRLNDEEKAAIHSRFGISLGIDINMVWEDVFGQEFRMTKGFKVNIKNGSIGARYTLMPFGDAGSLTQEEAQQRHEEQKARQKAQNAAT